MQPSTAYQSFSMLPVSTLYMDLRRDFNLSLKKSFLYLLNACEDIIDKDKFCLIDDKIRNLACNLKLSGFFSAIHIRLYRAIKAKAVSNVLEIFDKFLESDLYVKDIKFLNLSKIDNFYTNFIEEVCVSELVRENEYYFLDDEGFEKAKLKIGEGFDFLQLHFNEFYEEAYNLISEMLILNAKGIQAGTSLDLFGMVHKNHTYQLERITDVIDFIIHEQSHLYLHLLLKDDPLILNPLERYESPLRKEPRPLIGIYHATFVLSRIIYVLKICLEKSLLPIAEQEYCSGLINHYTKRFNIGYGVLSQHAQMTDFGVKILFSMQNLIHPLMLAS